MPANALILPVRQTCSYPAPIAATEGILTPLLPALMMALGATEFQLEKLPREAFRLACTKGSSPVFYVAADRADGRWVFEMSGDDCQEALTAMRLCRAHFDQWFGELAEGQRIVGRP
jgi:hypothetical protein